MAGKAAAGPLPRGLDSPTLGLPPPPPVGIAWWNSLGTGPGKVDAEGPWAALGTELALPLSGTEGARWASREEPGSESGLVLGRRAPGRGVWETCFWRPEEVRARTERAPRFQLVPLHLTVKHPGTERGRDWLKVTQAGADKAGPRGFRGPGHQARSSVTARTSEPPSSSSWGWLLRPGKQQGWSSAPSDPHLPRRPPSPSHCTSLLTLNELCLEPAAKSRLCPDSWLTRDCQ